jgi:hypothetical protein
MTGGALLINGGRFSRYEARSFRVVHPVACRTGHPASGMTALDAPDMSRLVAMAGEAGLVDSRRAQFRRVDDVIGCRRLDMRAGGPMATLASIVFPATLLIEINSFMRIFLKADENIFVTGLTGFGPDIRLWAGGRSSRLCLGRRRFRLLRWRFGRFLLLVAGIRQSDE